MKTVPPMLPRDWFILALRIIGILQVIGTIDIVISVFNVTAHLVRLERTDVNAYMTHGLASFVVATWLLKSAPAIARFFYPDPPPVVPTDGTSAPITGANEPPVA